MHYICLAFAHQYANIPHKIVCRTLTFNLIIFFKKATKCKVDIFERLISNVLQDLLKCPRVLVVLRYQRESFRNLQTVAESVQL